MPDALASLLASYHFDLPPELVAQRPPARRGESRLLVVRPAGVAHRGFGDLADLLDPGDLLVVNDSRVMQARCLLKRRSGGQVEVLFLAPGPGPVEAMLRPSRRLSVGERLLGPAGEEVEILEHRGDGTWLVRARPEPGALMEHLGQVPLPPYIRRPADADDRERYQTVYARPPGSSAAPTAGLHFDDTLLARLDARGIPRAAVTLHVGPGTFRPLREDDLARGELHAEAWVVPEETALAVRRCREQGSRVVAVGTTTVRALEAAVPRGATLPEPGSGITRLFLKEGDPIRVATALVTNFHLPGTSLILLVAAFLGRERLLDAYRQAVAERYRFYSYGDAMLVL
ncbi:MAG: tRNA preQ1(34) S-adenosylmethionine ribosyltransferase-isomerase QueA [Pseudomonadota bacterium]